MAILNDIYTIEVDVNLDYDGKKVTLKNIWVGNESKIDILPKLDEKQKLLLIKDFEETLEEPDSDSFFYEIDVELEIDYDYTKGTPEYFDRQFGNWLPGDQEELTINSVEVNGLDILPALSVRKIDSLEDSVKESSEG